MTFSLFEGGEIVLVDATMAEEHVREGEVIISMNRFGEVCQIAKYGGVTLEPLAMLNCTTIALEKVKGLHKFVMDKIAADEKRRDAGGLMAELSAENDR